MISNEGTVFEECVFGIKTAEGISVLGTALAAGELGYFRFRDESGRRLYSITHIKTGLRILAVRRSREARKFITAVKDLDWNFTDPAEGRKNAPACLKAMREAGFRTLNLRAGEME